MYGFKSSDTKLPLEVQAQVYKAIEAEINKLPEGSIERAAYEYVRSKLCAEYINEETALNRLARMIMNNSGNTEYYEGIMPSVERIMRRYERAIKEIKKENIPKI